VAGEHDWQQPVCLVLQVPEQTNLFEQAGAHRLGLVDDERKRFAGGPALEESAPQLAEQRTL